MAIGQYERALPGLERSLGPAHPAAHSARADLDRARRQSTEDAGAAAGSARP